MPIAKIELLGKTVDSGLVCVIRSDGSAAVVQITFTVPGASGVIGRTVPGATRIWPAKFLARCSIRSRAQYVVSPCVNTETARLANRYQIPYMPGTGTLGEVVAVRAVQGPLPQASLMPTGGVSIENVWMEGGRGRRRGRPFECRRKNWRLPFPR